MAEHPAGPSPADLLTSPLHRRHVELGARFSAFGGWSMPLEYSGALKEHTAVRSAVGMFDASHLGTVTVRGQGAAAYVNRCLTNDVSRIAAGQAQYSLCCNEAGGVVDDLIVYRRGDDEVLLIPNAANTSEVARLLSDQVPPSVEVVNQHGDFAVLAVQGPSSDEALQRLRLPTGHSYMSFVEAVHEGVTMLVCRTGYTGERGHELVVPRAAAISVWDALMVAGQPLGLVAAGLGARDILRTEMGYPLHGQDISPDITPVQARLAWAVGWEKAAFWGRDALRAEREAGATRVLRGVVAAGRGIPRSHMTVSSESDEQVGVITSGTFSPTRKQGVGLALVDRSVGDGDTVLVDVRGRREPFTVTKPPFITPGMRGS